MPCRAVVATRAPLDAPARTFVTNTAGHRSVRLPVAHPHTMTDHQPRPPSYLLPYTTLQPTYTEIYADVASNRVSAENVWLSVYSDNAPQKSIHAGMVLRLAEKDDAMQEDRVLVEVNKGGNVVSVQEVDVDDPKGKGRAVSVARARAGANTLTLNGRSCAHPPAIPRRPNNGLTPATINIPNGTPERAHNPTHHAASASPHSPQSHQGPSFRASNRARRRRANLRL